MFNPKWYHIIYRQYLLNGNNSACCGRWMQFNELLKECNFQFSRVISTSNQSLINYYDSLGITRNATQTDIKSAYYKLSMVYHPDKNEGCERSAKKFRDITAAYEVLGNFRLRRLYDKGIIHTAGKQYTQADAFHEEEEDDPQTKFYKARMKKSEVPHSSGRQPIYNFDEWSRAHYGSSFERRKAAKQRYETQELKKESIKFGIQNEILIFSIILCAGLFAVGALQDVGLDIDNTKKNTTKKES